MNFYFMFSLGALLSLSSFSADTYQDLDAGKKLYELVKDPKLDNIYKQISLKNHKVFYKDYINAHFDEDYGTVLLLTISSRQKDLMKFLINKHGADYNQPGHITHENKRYTLSPVAAAIFVRMKHPVGNKGKEMAFFLIKRGAQLQNSDMNYDFGAEIQRKYNKYFKSKKA